MKVRIAAGLMVGTVLVAPWACPSAVAASIGGTLYETFGSNGVSALSLSNPGIGVGNLVTPATNIAYGNGTVYLESGDTIFSTSSTLTGLTAVHVNGEAPTGIAVDPTDNILYETFGANGVVALNLSNPGTNVGMLGIAATGVAYANGTVYLESGDTIFSASPTLTGLSTLHVNGAAPTGIAVDPTDNIFYETFGPNGVSALNLSNPGMAFGFLGIAATNVAYADGTVYLESGDTIFTTTTTLAGLNTFHVNGQAPTGLAVMPATTTAVPEPASLGLLGAALAGLGLTRGRRRKLAQRS